MLYWRECVSIQKLLSKKINEYNKEKKNKRKIRLLRTNSKKHSQFTLEFSFFFIYKFSFKKPIKSLCFMLCAVLISVRCACVYVLVFY